MRILAGTSGFSYPAWKGAFYPADLPADRILAHYATRLPAVEINNTFYRMPQDRLLAGWATQTPAGFSFVLKCPRRLTHTKRLADVSADLERLLTVSTALGPRRGPFLFQLPPFFRKDVPRLEDFLATFDELRRGDATARAAFEFRHASWFDDSVFSCLRTRGAALCLAEDEDLATPPVATNETWGYLRLRRPDYDDAALATWVARMRGLPWREAFVFFKHEEGALGPRLAARFMELAAVER